jgi:riboflavin synthase
MFTGIITDMGRVRRVDRGQGRDLRLEIATAYDTGTIATGASIACSGICLTVVDKGPGWFAVEASIETLTRTTIGAWRKDTSVNLERPLRLGDELGGHLVLGHVDGLARVSGRRDEGGSLRLVFEIAQALGRFVAAKGSVTIDGVSLTVNEVHDLDTGVTRLGVNVIPHTRAVTTLGTLEVDDAVNLEADMMARYVGRLQGKD